MKDDGFGTWRYSRKWTNAVVTLASCNDLAAHYLFDRIRRSKRT